MAFILSKRKISALQLRKGQASATTNLSFSSPSLLPMEKLRSSLKPLHGGAAGGASPERKHSRFFFSPTTSSSIMEAAGGAEACPLCRGSTAVAVASWDPYGDFRASMEEMVAAADGAARDWRALRELLCCYLRLNEEQNHGVIVLAFADLLVNLLASSSSAAAE